MIEKIIANLILLITLLFIIFNHFINSKNYENI